MNRRILRALSRNAGPMLLWATRFVLPLLTRRDSKPSIAVLKIVGLGDTVLMLPVIGLIKRTFPDHRVCAIVTPATQPLLTDHPAIDDVFVYDVLGLDRGFRGFVRTLVKLRRQRFAMFLDFEQHQQLVPLIAAVSGAPIRIGLRHLDHDRGRLFTDPIRYDENTRIIELYYQIYVGLCRSRGRVPESFEALFDFSIPVAPDAKARVLKWKEESVPRDNKLIGLHPGSGGTNRFRRWPLENFSSLARLLIDSGYSVVVTGGPEERALTAALAESVGRPILRPPDSFGFKEFIALVGSLDCYVSNDTGPVHISPWVGTSTVGLYGPETPARYGAIHDNCVNLYKSLACSPCILVHRGINPDCTHVDKGACVKAITVQEVFDHVVGLAGKGAAKPGRGLAYMGDLQHGWQLIAEMPI